MRRAIVGSWLVVLAACGGASNPDDGNAAGAGGGSSSQAGTGGSSAGSGGGGGSGFVDGEGDPGCGDGNVDGNEECDDGNQVDIDGCTTMCEFTCSTDADCDQQADECSGSAMTCDTATHACLPGADKKADGEQCGDNASCYQGECMDNACGNGVKQADEECDDGNTDDQDGCTGECLFTCILGDPDRDTCANDCDQTATCDETTHACAPGEPLPDGTLCDLERGYCSDGVCTPSVCGNGNQEPNEECDDGNTTDGDNCTSTCTLSVCGNGIIDGNEQCDDGLGPDGKPVNLDGCDFRCRVELTFRGAGMAMEQGPAPDYCVYHESVKQGNSFAGLTPDPALMNTVNDYMKQMMDSGDMLYLFHVMDVDDPTGIVADPLIRSGMSVGIADPAGNWANTPKKLDFPLLVYREFYDDQLQPITISNAELVVENGKLIMQSSVPGTMGFESPQGTFIMHSIVTHIEIDAPRSKLAPPPESIDSLLLPESVGGQDVGEVTGVMCGALPAETFAKMGLPSGNVMGLSLPLMEMFCLDQGMSGKFKTCAEGQEPPDCSSVLELLQAGCTAPGLIPGTKNVYIAPIGDPDADIDGDGTNDAYSMVTRISGQRVKISGFATGDPPGRPIKVP